MALKAVVFLMIFLITISASMSSIHGRKLFMIKTKNEQHNSIPSNLEDNRLYLAALPKGTVPASTPSKKTHGGSTTMVDEKLIARHLSAVDRILRSVPSPGVGH